MAAAVYPQQHLALLTARTARQLSLRQLSDKTGIPHQRLSSVERGLSELELRKLAAALGCSVARLQSLPGAGAGGDSL